MSCLDIFLVPFTGFIILLKWVPVLSFFSKYAVDTKFIHVFFWEDKILSPYWNSIAPILDNLKAKKIIRVKANLTPKKNDNLKSEMHVDTNVKNSKTAVYYCNTNNGSTIFSDGKKVSSVENRIVTFESQTMHCGVDCTDKNIRVVINFNYL